MDSGNLILDDLKKLEYFLTENIIYSGVTSGDIKQWTYPQTINYLNCSWLNEENRNGACLGFNTNINFVKDFLLEFYNCAQTKECIFPDGSSRKNHRQDQAVFTILYYKFKNLYQFISYNNSNWKNQIGYSIHNDIEAHWDK